MGENRDAEEGLFRKPEENIPVGRYESRLEDNIKICLKEIDYEGMNWSNLAQSMDQRRALVDKVMHLRVP
jgi:hypothetical protein